MIVLYLSVCYPLPFLLRSHPLSINSRFSAGERDPCGMALLKSKLCIAMVRIVIISGRRDCSYFYHQLQASLFILLLSVAGVIVHTVIISCWRDCSYSYNQLQASLFILLSSVAGVIVHIVIISCWRDCSFKCAFLELLRACYTGRKREEVKC